MVIISNCKTISQVNDKWFESFRTLVCVKFLHTMHISFTVVCMKEVSNIHLFTIHACIIWIKNNKKTNFSKDLEFKIKSNVGLCRYQHHHFFLSSFFIQEDDMKNFACVDSINPCNDFFYGNAFLLHFLKNRLILCTCWIERFVMEGNICIEQRKCI